MQNRRWNSAALTTAVAAMTMSHLLAAQQTESSLATYFVFNLGAPGGISAAAASSSNPGWIAGDNFTSATTGRAELWVGTLVLANDINDAGEIVGFGIDERSHLVVAFLAAPVAHGDQRDRGEPRAAAVPDTVCPGIPMMGRLVGRTRVW